LSTIGDTIIKLIVVACAAMIVNVAAAQTVRYVSDDFQVPVRDAPRQDSRVVSLISSGTKVEVLDEGLKGFNLIRAQGIEGWVRTHDLMAIPSAKARLAEAEKRFEERRIALEQREQDVKDLRARVEDLVQRNQALESQDRELEGDLEVLRKRTARPLATEKENRQLEQALQQERDTVRRLLDENDALKVQALRDWFLIGAAVSLGCLLLGIIIGRIPQRKQRSW
jgi:SH3 domain protein